MFKKTAPPHTDMFKDLSAHLSHCKTSILDDSASWHNVFFREVTRRVNESVFEPLFRERGRPNAPLRVLTDLARLEKLVLLVMIAFVWCYKVGIYLHRIRPIKVTEHGRKAKSIFRYGLDYISNCLLNALKPMKIDISKFLSCT